MAVKVQTVAYQEWEARLVGAMVKSFSDYLDSLEESRGSVLLTPDAENTSLHDFVFIISPNDKVFVGTVAEGHEGIAVKFRLSRLYRSDELVRGRIIGNKILMLGGKYDINQHLSGVEHLLQQGLIHKNQEIDYPNPYGGEPRFLRSVVGDLISGV